MFWNSKCSREACWGKSLSCSSLSPSPHPLWTTFFISFHLIFLFHSHSYMDKSTTTNNFVLCCLGDAMPSEREHPGQQVRPSVVVLNRFLSHRLCCSVLSATTHECLLSLQSCQQRMLPDLYLCLSDKSVRESESQGYVLDLKKKYNVLTKDDRNLNCNAWENLHSAYSRSSYPDEASHYRRQAPHLPRLCPSDEWVGFYSCRAVEQTFTCQATSRFIFLWKTTIYYQVWEPFISSFPFVCLFICLLCLSYRYSWL